jgi:hypothetical protein
MTGAPGCLWCAHAFQPHDGGKPQRFCSEACRIALHRAARQWALSELAAGRVTVAQLKECLASNVYVGYRGDAGSGAIRRAPDAPAAPAGPARL